MAHDDVATRSNDILVRAVRAHTVVGWHGCPRPSRAIDGLSTLLFARSQLVTMELVMPRVLLNVVQFHSSAKKSHGGPNSVRAASWIKCKAAISVGS